MNWMRLLGSTPKSHIFKLTCLFCGKEQVIPLNKEKWKRWRDGELIQNVFPELEEREWLISGTCNDCFDSLFEEREDFRG